MSYVIAVQTLIADLLDHPRVRETSLHIHHSIPKHDHLLRSARYSARLAVWFRADQLICVRAAILHDIDSRKGTLTTHGAIAARVAVEELGESEAVAKAIVSHMFPLGPRPTTREGWVLAVADKIASLTDITTFLSGLFDGRSLRVRRELQLSDPYYVQRVSRWRRLLRRTDPVS